MRRQDFCRRAGAINSRPKRAVGLLPARFGAGLCSPAPIGRKIEDRNPIGCPHPPANIGCERSLHLGTNRDPILILIHERRTSDRE